MIPIDISYGGRRGNRLYKNGTFAEKFRDPDHRTPLVARLTHLKPFHGLI